MKYRNLGNTGVSLSAVGLGCMGMSQAYGPGNDEESLRVLKRALELGINFWDTADMYGAGHNEQLISKVLGPNRDKIFLATKFGFRLKGGLTKFGYPSTYIDGSPEYVRTAAEMSLKRLKTDVIDLYYLHRIDQTIPVEDTVGAMSELVKAGKVRYIGLSEASAPTIRKAHAIHPITALESEYSIMSRDIEGDILNTCRELDITVVPYSPLSRGLMSATIIKTEELAQDDFRRTLPRFSDKYYSNNKKLVNEFAEMARAQNCTPAQFAIAWVLAQGDDVIPIPGTKRIKYLEENAGAADINLTPDSMEAVDRLLEKYPDTGLRFNDMAMSLVNK